MSIDIRLPSTISDIPLKLESGTLPDATAKTLRQIETRITAADPLDFTFHGHDTALDSRSRAFSYPVFHGRDSYVGIGSDPLIFDAEEACWFPRRAIGSWSLPLDDGNVLHLIKIQPITQGEQDYSRYMDGRGGSQPGEGYFFAIPDGNPMFLALIAGQAKERNGHSIGGPILFQSPLRREVIAEVASWYNRILSAHSTETQNQQSLFRRACRATLSRFFGQERLAQLPWTIQCNEGSRTGACKQEFRAIAKTPVGEATLAVEYRQDGVLFGQIKNPSSTLKVSIEPNTKYRFLSEAEEIMAEELRRALPSSGIRRTAATNRALQAARERCLTH